MGYQEAFFFRIWSDNVLEGIFNHKPMINNLLRTIFIVIAVSFPAISQVKPIIGVAGIAHESNSFNI